MVQKTDGWNLIFDLLKSYKRKYELRLIIFTKLSLAKMSSFLQSGSDFAINNYADFNSFHGTMNCCVYILDKAAVDGVIVNTKGYINSWTSTFTSRCCCDVD